MTRDSNRSILRVATMLGMLGLGICASPAVAQLAPWQQPPGSGLPAGSGLPEYVDPSPVPLREGVAEPLTPTSGVETPDHSSNPWTGDEYEQEGTALGFGRGYLSNFFCDSVHDQFWFRCEFLGWWTKGFATPPLLTTSPTSPTLTPPAQAGVLGGATNVLFGGNDLGGGFLPGERITFGALLDGCRNLGIEASYLQLNRQTKYFNANSVSVPILARPYFNSETGQQDSQVIAYPGQQSGTFSSSVASDLQVVDVLVRKRLNQQPGFAVDLVAGYRYQQLEDYLTVDSLTISGTQSGFADRQQRSTVGPFRHVECVRGRRTRHVGLVSTPILEHRHTGEDRRRPNLLVRGYRRRDRHDDWSRKNADCTSRRTAGLAKQHRHAL